MGASRNRAVRRCRHQLDLSAIFCGKHNDGVPELLLRLVTQVAHTVHIHIRKLADKNADTIYVLRRGSHIARRSFRQFRFQLVVLLRERFHLFLHSRKLLYNLHRVCLEKLRRLVQLLLDLIVMRDQPRSRKRLNSAHTGSYTALRNNLKCGNVSCVPDMRTPAELRAEITHLHYPDFIPIFFPEKRHCARFLCILQRHFTRYDGKPFRDLLIDDLLNPANFLICHRRKMSKVETQLILVHEGTRLFHMVAEYDTQRLLHQVGGTVVICRKIPPVLVHRKRDAVTGPDGAGNHLSHMPNLRSLKLNGIHHGKFPSIGGDRPGICRLAAHRRIKWRLVNKYRAFHSLPQFIHYGIRRSQNGNFRFMHQSVITYKPASNPGINQLVHSDVRSHIICHFPGIPRHFPLYLHRLPESLPVDRHTLFL